MLFFLLLPSGVRANKKPTAGSTVGSLKLVRIQNPTAAPLASSAFDSSRFRFNFTAAL
jgi:hypothetical protein